MPVKVLELGVDRIIVRKPTGEKRLDTDLGLLHIVGDRIDGSASKSAVGGVGSSTPAISQTNDTVIATGRNPACTDLLGAIYMGGVSGQAAAFNRWTTYMGGTLVWGLSGASTIPIPGLGMTYTFFLDGSGNVIMRQEVRIRAATFAWGFAAHTITWKLKTGLFT